MKMKTKVTGFTLLFAVITMGAGCGATSSEASDAPNAAAEVDATLYQLTEEPDGALGVIAARESAEDGSPLVLVGRVGGATNPWIDGRAAFMVYDASMNVVSDGAESEEGEMCMGDCCATERANCTTLVKVVDANGQLVPVDSRELLGIRESDMVVVQGESKRDEHGNFVMLARGVFVRQ